MSSWKPSVKWGTQTGQPINSSIGKITPISWALQVMFPNSGFVWNRPVAVEIDRIGQVQRVTIVDVTRISIFVMAGLGLGVTLGAFLLTLARRPTNAS